MSSFFSSLSSSKRNKYDTKKLSTLETLHKTLEKEISNCHELLDEIRNKIWSTRAVYSPEFHGEIIDVEERDGILNELITTETKLITKLQSFEKRMEDVSSSLPKQRSIREDTTNELEKELSYVLRKHLNDDARNKVINYVNNLDLSRHYSYSEGDTRKRKRGSGKSRKNK